MRAPLITKIFLGLTLLLTVAAPMAWALAPGLGTAYTDSTYKFKIHPPAGWSMKLSNLKEGGDVLHAFYQDPEDPYKFMIISSSPEAYMSAASRKQYYHANMAQLIQDTENNLTAVGLPNPNVTLQKIDAFVSKDYVDVTWELDTEEFTCMVISRMQYSRFRQYEVMICSLWADFPAEQEMLQGCVDSFELQKPMLMDISRMSRPALVIMVLAFIGAIFGVRWYLQNMQHGKTDDAGGITPGGTGIYTNSGPTQRFTPSVPQTGNTGHSYSGNYAAKEPPPAPIKINRPDAGGQSSLPNNLFKP